LPESRAADLGQRSARWLAELQRCAFDVPSVTPLELDQAAAFSDSILARQTSWPDPTLAGHALATKAAIDVATTPIAREAISEERNCNFQIEATWNSLLLTSLLAPLRAMATHGWARSLDSEEAILKAIRTTHALTGFGPRAILQLPGIQRHLENNFWPGLEAGTESLGAMQGEAGFDLLQHACAWKQASGSVDFEALLPSQEPTLQPLPILHWGLSKPVMGFGI
jgi:hypothetical protein